MNKIKIIIFLYNLYIIYRSFKFNRVKTFIILISFDKNQKYDNE